MMLIPWEMVRPKRRPRRAALQNPLRLVRLPGKWRGRNGGRGGPPYKMRRVGLRADPFFLFLNRVFTLTLHYSAKTPIQIGSRTLFLAP
jgi:hypothetical protein